MKVFSMPDKSKSVIVKGIKRIKIKKVIQDYPYFKANIENLEEDNQITEDVQHITSNLKNLFANCNLKIKKILVKNFVKGANISQNYKIETFFYLRKRLKAAQGARSRP